MEATETQKNTMFSVSDGVKINEVKPSLNPTIASEYKTLLPEYVGANSYWFKYNYLHNTEFRNNYINKVFDLALSDPSYREKFKDEKELNQAKIKFDNRIQESFIKESYVGEPLKDLIIERAYELDTELYKRNPDTFDSTRFLDIVNKKKEYEHLRDLDNTVFTTRLLADKQLYKKLLEEDYNEFLAELGKYNNISFQTDPNNTIIAYNTYRMLGGEGVTQLVNSLNGDKEATEKVKQLAQQKTGKLSLAEYNSLFFGDEKSPFGKLTYTPLTPTPDLVQTPPPHDYNAFTSLYYDAKGDYKVMAKSLFDIATQKNTDEGILDKMLSLFGGYDENYTVEQLALDLQTGEMTDGLEYTIQQIIRKSDGQAPYQLKDVFDTVLANAKKIETHENGNYIYTINYDELAPHQKLAFNVINYDSSPYKVTVREVSDGLYTIEPDKVERITQEYKSSWYDTNRHYYIGEDGLLKYDETLTGLGTLSLGATKSYQVLYDILKPYADWVIENYSYGSGDLIKNTDLYIAAEERANVPLNTLTTDWVDTLVENGSSILTYAAAMYGTGLAATKLAGVVLGGAGRLFNRLSGVKNLLLEAQAAQYAAKTLPKWNKAYAIAKNLLNQKGVLGSTLRFEVGGAIVDALDTENSIYRALPDPIEDAYLRSDALTQSFANGVSSLVISGILDSVWGAMKYVPNKFRSSSRGLNYNPATGDFDKVAKAVYASDWRRLWYNATKDLADLPAGEVADSYANAFKGRAFMFDPTKAATKADVFTKFKNEAGELLSDMRSDIEATLKYHDERFNAKPMSEEALRARVDKIYNKALDDIADNLYKQLKGADTETFELPLALADYLKQITPTIRRVSDSDELPFYEAVEQLSGYTNRVIKRKGKDTYGVYEVTPDFWAYDLAKRIEKKYLNPSIEDAIDNELQAIAPEILKKKRSGQKLTEDEVFQLQKITQRANDVIGKRVLHTDGRPVRIIGFSDEGFKAVDSMGNIVENVRPRQVPYIDLRPRIQGENNLLPSSTRESGSVVLYSPIEAQKAVRRMTKEQYDALPDELRQQVDELFSNPLGQFPVVPSKASSLDVPEPSLEELVRTTEQAIRYADDETMRGIIQNMTPEVYVRLSDEAKQILDEKLSYGLQKVTPQVGNESIAQAEEKIANTINALKEQAYEKAVVGEIPFVEVNALVRRYGIAGIKPTRDAVYEKIVQPLFKKLEKQRQRLDSLTEKLNETSKKQYKREKVKQTQLEKIADEIETAKQDMETTINQIYVTSAAVDQVFAKEGLETEGQLVAKRLRETYNTIRKLQADENFTPFELVDGDPMYKTHGFNSFLVKRLSEIQGRPMTTADMRKFLEQFGADNNIHLGVLGKQKTPIKELDIAKLKTEGVKAGVIVKYNGSFYMAKKYTKNLPYRFTLDLNGNPIASSKWAQVNINRTLQANGEPVKFVHMGGNTFIRSQNPDVEDWVYLNIQNPRLVGMNKDDMVRANVDAIQRDKGEFLEYEILDPNSQVVHPKHFHKRNQNLTIEEKHLPKC